MKKDMDKRSYPVLLPFELKGNTLLVIIDIPRSTKVSLEILDMEYKSINSLIDSEQEPGEVKCELNMAELPVNAIFIRLSSDGYQVVRRLEA